MLCVVLEGGVCYEVGRCHNDRVSNHLVGNHLYLFRKGVYSSLNLCYAVHQVFRESLIGFFKLLLRVLKLGIKRFNSCCELLSVCGHLVLDVNVLNLDFEVVDGLLELLVVVVDLICDSSDSLDVGFNVVGPFSLDRVTTIDP